MTDHLPPHDREAERCLLSSMLRGNKIIPEVLTLVRPTQLYVFAHQKIFEAITVLNDGAKPADIYTTAQQLLHAKLLDEIGGPEYLVDLWEVAPTPSNFRFYAEGIRNEATKREAMHIGQDLAALAITKGVRADEVREFAERSLLAYIESGCTNETHHVSETLHETWELLDRRRALAGQASGITSGFASLDRITAGFQPGELIVVAARPGVGKTAMVANIARHVAVDCRTPMLFISLEQSRVELQDRIIQSIAQIDSHQFMTGLLSEADAKRAFEAGESLSRSGLFINDSTNQTLVQLAADIRRMKHSHGIRLVLIDYLQLIEPVSRREPRHEQVAHISRRLKLLAREVRLPIIVAAQLNREIEKRTDSRPRLSDLRESGAIEQDADLVILLHRHADERGHSEGIVETIVAKHRNGRTGSAFLLFVNQHLRLEDLQGSL